MDIPQIRKLKPALEEVPQAVRRLLPPQGHPRPSAGLHLRAALRHPREERRADRHQRRRAAPDLAGVPQPAPLGPRPGCATGSSTSSATSTPGRTPSASSTRPATSRRGTRPPACSGSGAARWARRRTASSRSTWATPATASTACSTASCTCPRAGRRTATAAARPASPTTWSTGPSGRSPWSCTTAPSPTACTSTG